MLVVVAGLVSVQLGQDANWDLQNYHFYNPWAWMHGHRGYDWDLVAAQLQTFHNPIPDLPFYAMDRDGWNPRTISFVLAIPAGIAAFFVLKLAGLLFADLPFCQRVVACGAAVAVGMSSGVGIGVLGTTMNEWPGSALTVGSVFVIVHAIARYGNRRLPLRTLLLAGILSGLATGTKFTFGVFAVGLCAALLFRVPYSFARVREAVGESFVFGLAVLVGTAIVSGPWMWALWTHFQNPIFPYGNIWINSPWWGQYEVLARRFGPHSLAQWIVFPFNLAAPPPFFVSEVRYVDGRIPAVYCLAIASAGVTLVAHIKARFQRSPIPNSVATSTSALWRFIGLFWIVSFLLWTAQYSIVRYIVTLHILSGLILVKLLRDVVRPQAHWVTTILVASLLIWTTSVPDWWRIEYGKKWVDVQIPALEDRALILLTSDAPMSYALPFFPADARFLGINNSISDANRVTLLEEEIRRTIRSHDGPLYSMTYPAGTGVDALLARRLLVVTETCIAVTSNMRTSPIELCRVVKMPAP